MVEFIIPVIIAMVTGVVWQLMSQQQIDASFKKENLKQLNIIKERVAEFNNKVFNTDKEIEIERERLKPELIKIRGKISFDNQIVEEANNVIDQLK